MVKIFLTIASIFIFLFSFGQGGKKIIVGSGVFPNQSNFDSSQYYKKSAVNALIPTIVPGQNTTVSNTGNAYTINSQASATSNTVTEKKSYYNQEFILYKNIDTANGDIITDSTKSISGYIEIEPSTSITLSSFDSSYQILYGWTYDSAFNPLAGIRNSYYSTFQGRTTGSYSFTTPSNAKYICIITNTNALSSDMLYDLKPRINSTSAITYNTPITPEQFTGTATERIQKAVKLARWTSTGVTLNGVYGLDSAIFLYSNTHLILNNALIFRNVGMYDNFFRNSAVAIQRQPFPQGNRNISITGVGNAVIRGSIGTWGTDTPIGVDSAFWKAFDIYIGNVDNWSVSGLTFQNTNYTGLVTEQARHGDIGFLHFDAAIRRFNIKTGVPQGIGGLAVCSGSYDINIHDITGFCGDDFVALYNSHLTDSSQAILGGPGAKGKNYMPFRTDMDVYGITIRNIKNDGNYPSTIRFQCTGGLKIHDVNVDGVSGWQAIVIQLGNNAWGQEYAGKEYNISISNTGRVPIYINKGINNLSLINVALTDTGKHYLSAVIPDSSFNVYRKFIGQAPEYIDSVIGGTTYKSVVNKINPNAMTTSQRNALTGLTKGREIFCTDCTANDSSTGVGQMYTGSAWKNEW